MVNERNLTGKASLDHFLRLKKEAASYIPQDSVEAVLARERPSELHKRKAIMPTEQPEPEPDPVFSGRDWHIVGRDEIIPAVECLLMEKQSLTMEEIVVRLFGQQPDSDILKRRLGTMMGSYCRYNPDKFHLAVLKAGGVARRLWYLKKSSDHEEIDEPSLSGLTRLLTNIKHQLDVLEQKQEKMAQGIAKLYEENYG